MIEKDQKIRKGLPAKRGEASYQTQHDIMIPAGTILRDAGDDYFATVVGPSGEFSICVKPGNPAPDGFKRVVAG